MGKSTPKRLPSGSSSSEEVHLKCGPGVLVRNADAQASCPPPDPPSSRSEIQIYAL